MTTDDCATCVRLMRALMEATVHCVDAEVERRTFMLSRHPEEVDVNEAIADLDIKTAAARVARDEAQWRLVKHKHSAH